MQFLRPIVQGLILALWTTSGQANSEATIPLDITPDRVIHWSAGPGELALDNRSLAVTLSLVTLENFSIYRQNLDFAVDSGMIISDIEYPPFEEITDPLSGEQVEIFRGGEFTLKLESFDDPRSISEFEASVTFVGCTEKVCLFPHTVSLPIAVLAGSQGSRAGQLLIEDDLSPDLDVHTKGAEPTISPPTGISNLTNSMAAQALGSETPLWQLLALVFLAGLLTNLTPCVYPMIPITIRILSHQKIRPVFGAGLYALGILASYTILGVVTILSGTMFGSFMGSTWVNLVLALLMFVLGTTMISGTSFSGLQRLGHAISGKEPGPASCLLMGLGAGLVAAPCTGPIFAALLAYAHETSLHTATYLIAVYAAGFALPYFLLGAAASRVAAIKVPKLVITTTKLLFGAAIYGLGFYYLRIPLRGALISLAPFWQEITLGSLAIAVLGLVFTRARFPSTTALICGLFLFTLVSRPSIPTDTKTGWIAGETPGLAVARKNRAPVLMDLWAEWCEACKKMDRTTFRDSNLNSFLADNRWVLIKEDLTESTPESDALTAKYEVLGLPTLIVIPDPRHPNRFVPLTGYMDGPTLLARLRTITEAQ